MATDKSYVEFVCEQLPEGYSVRYRKMFGEYMIYVNEKPVFCVCDNTVFVKILPQTEELMKNCERGFPYPGAKEHYVVDVEDRVFLEKVLPAYLNL